MINVNDLKVGMTIMYENNIYSVMDTQHVKPGKGAAFVQAKLKNLRSGSIIENRFNSSDKVEPARIEKKPMQFLYQMNDVYYFMDMNTYEQIEVPVEKLDGKEKYLKENQEIDAIYLEEELIGIDMPLIVEMTIIEAEPGIKGDSVTNLTKFAKIETGAEIKVPLFIKEGDRIKVDTRTGEYVERISQ